MRGVYTSALKISSLASSKTLFYITAPAAKVVEILSASVTNESNATNFQAEIEFRNITSLGTPTATIVVPNPHEFGDQAAGSTTKINVTASEPTYAATCIWAEGFPSLTGWRFDPLTDAERIFVGAGLSLGIKMITTPTSFDAMIRVTFKEIG